MVTQYASEKIGEDEWGLHWTIGLIRNGKVIAACVLNQPSRVDIQMHIAAEGNFWLTPEFAKACFETVFVKFGVLRATTLASSTNAKALRLAPRLGFTQEGVKRYPAWDMIMFGMLKEECRWI